MTADGGTKQQKQQKTTSAKLVGRFAVLHPEGGQTQMFTSTFQSSRVEFVRW